MKFEWYILFVRKNYEAKILRDFDELTSLEKFRSVKEKISQIKFLDRKDRNGVSKNTIPGYMFIKCHVDKEVLDFVYSIKEIVGFLNYDKNKADQKPSPLSNLEVSNFFLLLEREENEDSKLHSKFKKNTKANVEKPKKTGPFVVGDIVIIKEGVFRDNQGSIVQINKNLLTVNVEFLGRFTPVSIDSSHCEKI